jgi:hypothetical protein
MKYLGLIFLFFISSALASTKGYDLNMDLVIDGKKISSPKAIVEAGKPATIIQKKDGVESFIEVIASEGELQGRKGILMDFEIGYIGKNGKREVVSKAKILAKEKEPATITIHDGKTHKETLSLSVTATKTSL